MAIGWNSTRLDLGIDWSSEPDHSSISEEQAQLIADNCRVMLYETFPEANDAAVTKAVEVMQPSIVDAAETGRFDLDMAKKIGSQVASILG